MAYEVSLIKAYSFSKNEIIELFRDQRFFQLTGADTVETIFKVGGPFKLIFNNRGVISGHFVKISEDEIILDWNVDGFEKPMEAGTIVTIKFERLGEGSKLKLDHTNIQHTEAAAAKKKAWTEILDNIESKLKNYQVVL